MNKAVIYFGATGNEAADQMVMQVLEEYCTVNGYEVVAVISENARPEGMTFPMIVSYQERCKYKAFRSLRTTKNNI